MMACWSGLVKAATAPMRSDFADRKIVCASWQDSQMTSSKPLKLNRGPSPAWARYLGIAIAYVILWPLTWLLGLLGIWPRFVVRLMNKSWKSFGEYVPDEHDVLVCSYFKSGTNWTLQIAQQIAFRGNAEFEHIHDIVPWPDMNPRARYAVPIDDKSVLEKSPTGLRVIKTHLELSKVPYNEHAKYICVVRDPKDVFVSSYHFIKSIGLGFLMPSVAQWLELHLSEDTPTGSWAVHTSDAWRMRNAENVLFLTYEEMRRDLNGAVSRIAELMGVALEPAELDRVVEQSTYAHMKSIQRKFDVPNRAPWASKDGAMVRRGESGVSGELIGLEDQRRIDDYWAAELTRIGSDFPYNELYGARSRAESTPAMEIKKAI